MRGAHARDPSRTSVENSQAGVSPEPIHRKTGTEAGSLTGRGSSERQLRPPPAHPTVIQDADRMLHLNRLRTRIEEGRYAVDPTAVADAVLRRLAARRREQSSRDFCGAVSPPDARSPRAFGGGLPAG